MPCLHRGAGNRNAFHHLVRSCGQQLLIHLQCTARAFCSYFSPCPFLPTTLSPVNTPGTARHWMEPCHSCSAAHGGCKDSGHARLPYRALLQDSTTQKPFPALLSSSGQSYYRLQCSQPCQSLPLNTPRFPSSLRLTKIKFAWPNIGRAFIPIMRLCLCY